MTPLNNLKASCRAYLLTVFKSLRGSIKFSFMSHPINHACFKSVTNSFHISPLAKNQMSRVFFRTKISEKKTCTWNSKETYFAKNKYVPKDWFIKNLTNAVIIQYCVCKIFYESVFTIYIHFKGMCYSHFGNGVCNGAISIICNVFFLIITMK